MANANIQGLLFFPGKKTRCWWPSVSWVDASFHIFFSNVFFFFTAFLPLVLRVVSSLHFFVNHIVVFLLFMFHPMCVMWDFVEKLKVQLVETFATSALVLVINYIFVCFIKIVKLWNRNFRFIYVSVGLLGVLLRDKMYIFGFDFFFIFNIMCRNDLLYTFIIFIEEQNLPKHF